MALCLYSPQAGGGWGAGVWVDGQSAPGPKDDNVASWNRVTAGYFDVIGNPIVKGRGISEQDTAASRHVAVINEAFARKFFRNEDAIGKHFGREAGASRQFEVVGVAKDARYLTDNLDQPDSPLLLSARSTSRIHARQSGLAVPARHRHSDPAGSEPVHCADTPGHGFRGSQSADHFDSHA